MVRRKPGIGKGVLHPRGAREKFSVGRFHPSADLRPLVEHLWTVSWALGDGPPHVQETLPDPSVHIVLERGASEVVGVLRGRFRRRLLGEGRALQRLFRRYVGVSPKWVIRRSRLQNAAEALASAEVDLADLAAELGYADQAHFVRDFRALVGTTPGAYARDSVGGS